MFAEQQLKASQKNIGDLIAALDGHASVVVTDAQGRITYANEKFCTLSKYAREQLLGQNARILNSGHHPKEYIRGLWETLTRGEVWKGGFKNRARDGSFYWVEMTIVPFGDEHGELQQLVSIGTEITDREESRAALRERENLFSTAFQFSPDGVLITRCSDRKVIQANHRLCELWGCTMDQVLGKPAKDLATWRSEEERLNFIKQLEATGEYLNYETVLRLADGHLVDFNISCRLVTLNGEACFLTILRDISERRQAEAATARLAAIVQSSNDAIIGKNLEGVVTSWNAGAEKIFGYTAAEMLGQSVLRLIPVERQAEEVAILERIRRGEGLASFDTVRRRKDGSLVDISLSTSPIKDANGKVIGASKMARDITASKRVQAEHQKLAQLIEHSRDFIAMADLDGRITFMNSGARRMIGMADDCDPTAISFTDYVPPEWQQFFLNTVIATARDQGLWEGEMQLRHLQTGARIDVFRSTFLLCDATGRPDCFATVTRDITEAKRAEVALRESEQRMRLATEANAVGIWEWNIRTNQIRWDAQMFRIYGVPPTMDGLVEYTTWSERVFPEDLPRQEEVLQSTARHGGRSVRQFRIRRASDQECRHIEAVETVRPDEQGRTEWVVGTNLDVTERLAAQTALQESEERFRTMANSIPQLAWSARADGHVTWYNRRWYEYTGTTPEQMELQGWQHVHDPKLLPLVQERWQAAIAAGEPLDMEFPLRGADGRFRTFLTRVQPLKDSTGRVMQWFGTNTDVETLKQAEEAVRVLNSELEQRVTERTAELEAFSYSISHDLRAPLRAMGGFARILQEDCAALLPADALQKLDRIHENAKKMGHLIDGLLSFSRLTRQPLNKRELAPALIVQQVLESLQPEREGRNVEITVAELPVCLADPMLLQQVFVNLLSNALKYSRQRNPACIQVGCRMEAGPHVYFVRDNGAGFDMKYADKLFGVFQRLHRAEDFEGTGVGLAIVDRIVRRHGGRIWTEAQPDGGATFYFTLSASENHG